MDYEGVKFRSDTDDLQRSPTKDVVQDDFGQMILSLSNGSKYSRVRSQVIGDIQCGGNDKSIRAPE